LTAEQYVQHILPDAVVYAVAKDSQGKPLVLLRARSVSLPGEYGWGDMPDTWALSIDPATLAITGTYAYLPVPDGFFDHDIATPWPELLPSQAPPSQSLSKTFDGSCISFKYPESWSVWFDDVRNEGPYWQELTIVANLTQSADGGAERQFVPGEIKIDIMARELRSSEHDMARSGEPHPIVIDGRALTAYLHDDPVWGPSVGVAVDVGNLRYSAGAGLGSRDDLPAALSVMRTLKLKCDMSPG
jgi:hypothetical protein